MKTVLADKYGYSCCCSDVVSINPITSTINTSDTSLSSSNECWPPPSYFTHLYDSYIRSHFYENRPPWSKKELKSSKLCQPLKSPKSHSPIIHAKSVSSSPIRSPTRSPTRSPIKSPMKSPAKSPIKSPVKSPVKSPRLHNKRKRDNTDYESSDSDRSQIKLCKIELNDRDHHHKEGHDVMDTTVHPQTDAFLSLYSLCQQNLQKHEDDIKLDKKSHIYVSSTSHRHVSDTSSNVSSASVSPSLSSLSAQSLPSDSSLSTAMTTDRSQPDDVLASDDDHLQHSRCLMDNKSSHYVHSYHDMDQQLSPPKKDHLCLLMNVISS